MRKKGIEDIVNTRLCEVRMDGVHTMCKFQNFDMNIIGYNNGAYSCSANKTRKHYQTCQWLVGTQTAYLYTEQWWSGSAGIPSRSGCMLVR